MFNLFDFSAKNLKKISFIFTLCFLCGSAVFAVFFAFQIRLPNVDQPLLFYSNQNRQDLQQIFLKAFHNAQKSLLLYIYALTDPRLVSKLAQKSATGVQTCIFYDPSASPAHLLSKEKNILAYPVRCGGLMHRKIVVIDEKLVLLGSANLTSQSLLMHDNLVFGMYAPSLAKALKNPSFASFQFEIGKQNATLFLLPDVNHYALNQLLDALSKAKKKIRIAMFTLTHPKIIDALIDASRKNVDVRIALDFFTAKGASLKSVDRLKQEKIPVYFSQGQQLLHHKWAFVDDEILISGSANWTQAAFCKNQDCFLLLRNLSLDQKKFMKGLWKTIRLESFSTNANIEQDQTLDCGARLG